jgi:L-threonylcarbamoyladenylate synthase
VGRDELGEDGVVVVPVLGNDADPEGEALTLVAVDAPAVGSADAVDGAFGDRLDLLLDGGATPGGLPSTLIDACGKELRVLRAGAWRTAPDGIVRPA